MYANLTVYLDPNDNSGNWTKVIATSPLNDFGEQERFGSLIEKEVAYFLDIPSIRVAADYMNVTLTSAGLVAVKFKLLGPDTTKSNLEALVQNFTSGVSNRYGTLYRFYALKNANSTIPVLVEGDNLFSKVNPSVLDRLAQVWQWIKDNLEIVIPVLAVLFLLIAYKIWKDSRDSENKKAVAGVKDRDPGKKKGQGKYKHQKKKHEVDRHKKHKEERRGERDIEEEYGARVVRKAAPSVSASELPPPSYDVESAGSERDEKLPANWTVQYFDDGTKFYFNSVTNDISTDRPKR
jgi:hypothetical protein